MSHTQGAGALDEWKRNWTVALAGSGGMALASVHVYSTGVFIAPLETEFGWTRAQITSGLTISSFIGVLTAPFVGMAVDRFGPRRIGLYGGALFLTMIALLSQANASIWSWWTLWLGLATMAITIKPTIWTTAVSSLFVSSRGLALSVMLCGTAVGSSLTPLVSNKLITDFGWRIGYMGLAAFWAVLVLPVLFFFLTSARDQHRLQPNASNAAPPVLTGVSVREGFLSPSYWKLAGAGLLASLALIAFVVNLVPILASTGQPLQTAAQIASTLGLSNIVGRLTAGYLLDRINGNLIGGVSMLLPLVSCSLLLTMPGSVPAALAATAVLGLALGAELDAVAYLASRHFGMRNFGVLFGTISGLLAFSTGVGPLMASHVYDVTRSYELVLMANLVICSAASLLFFSLGKYPTFDPPSQ